MHIPPIVALFLTVAFVVFLFRRDIRERPDVTSALWVPLIWFLIICSRQVSEWLNTFGLHAGAITLEEGSPLDRCIYLGLIAAGTYVLSKRHVQVSEIIRQNQWLTIFFIYCFLAIFWSDFPFVAFKRWIKVLGHPIMALIVLTEPDPLEALTRLMKRCAYVIVPVSILFIKYYPELGRGFDHWTGAPSNNGITTNKNTLGVDCLILGFFFFWHLLQTRSLERGKLRRNELFLTGGFLLAIWWLFSMAHSSTALVSFFDGVLGFLILGLRFVDKRFIGTYVVIGVVGLLLLIVLLTATFWKGRRELLTNFQFGRFRLGFLAAIVAYNWTEAAFKNISAIWFVFYIIALDYRQPEFDSFQTNQTFRKDGDERLVYAEGENDTISSDF